MAGNLLSTKDASIGGNRGILSSFSKRCIDLSKTLCSIWMTRNSSTEDVTKQTTLKDLPEEVTIDILMRLPVESLCCVQCVSKTTFGIARSPDFATLHNLHLTDSVMNSLMLVTTWRSNDRVLVWQTWQSFKYNGSEKTLVESRHVPQICFKHDFYVDFVFSNLFLLRSWSTGSPCLLINPLREEVLELPSSNIQVPTRYFLENIVDWYGMGFDNVSSKYKIVYVSANKKRNCVVAQVLVLGTSSWKQIHLAPPFDVSSLFSGKSNKNGIYVAGDMHWLIYQTRESPGTGHIISFNFNREEFYTTLPPTGHVFHKFVWLLKFRGCLALTEFHMAEDNIKIWVLKSYDIENKWELQHNVTIEHLRFCFVATEICGEWEHGIFVASDGECYFFDLRHLRTVRVGVPYPTLSFSIFSSEFWTTARKRSSIFSYTESLISLKNYGKLNGNKSEKGLDSSTHSISFHVLKQDDRGCLF